MKGRKSFHVSTILILLLGCIEPYSPSGIKNAPHLLVVDGFLNATDGSISVRLSRTVSLTSNNPPPAETGAEVRLEEENGGTIILTETLGGVYKASPILVDTDARYRLTILTQGQNYASEFVPVKITPPIENIEFRPTSDELRILITTEDPTGKTGYYRWRFSETYAYSAPLTSSFKIHNGQVVERTQSERIDLCWKTNQITDIHIAASRGLSKDRIVDHLLTSIPRESLKISRRYYIDVQQQALTAEGYNYWLGIFKTTENVGGLFDPLPGQVSGNLYNVADPKEFVVGFFSAATISRKAVAVERYELPEGFVKYRPGFCQIDTIRLGNISGTSNTTLLYQGAYKGPTLIGYLTSSPNCLDCRVYGGGVTTKPDFWP